MATSGSTNWTLTRNDIIKGALRNLTVIAQGETPSASDIADGAEALNALIKQWQTEGCKLWLYDEEELSLTANSQSYTIGSGGNLDTTKPIEIMSARYHYNTSGIDIPMTALSRDEYFDLPLKSSPGVPLNYYPDYQTGDYVYFYIWPIITSATSDTIKMTLKTEVEDFDSASNDADFPKEWLRALKFNLAVDLAPEYGREAGQTLVALAVSSKQMVKDWDREKNVSVYFGLNRRHA